MEGLENNTSNSYDHTTNFFVSDLEDNDVPIGITNGRQTKQKLKSKFVQSTNSSTSTQFHRSLSNNIKTGLIQTMINLPLCIGNIFHHGLIQMWHFLLILFGFLFQFSIASFKLFIYANKSLFNQCMSVFRSWISNNNNNNEDLNVFVFENNQRYFVLIMANA